MWGSRNRSVHKVLDYGLSDWGIGFDRNYETYFRRLYYAQTNSGLPTASCPRYAYRGGCSLG